jgi:hypothetical protein
MKTRPTLFCLLATLAFTVGACRASAATSGPFTMSFNNLVTGAGPLSFSFPKFDSSLGLLQSVDIEWEFSGTVVGSASGVSQSDSINSTVSHWVFFDFMDVSSNIGIAEPTLGLTASIPPGAQNATIAFGPSFQSTSYAFSVTSPDMRFQAWGDGPGDVSGSLNVFFTNTAQGFTDLKFFPGDDSGVYNGWLSVAYSYVPEPSGLTLAALGLLMVCRRRLKRGPSSEDT